MQLSDAGFELRLLKEGRRRKEKKFEDNRRNKKQNERCEETHKKRRL